MKLLSGCEWSKEDLRILRKMFGNLPNREVAVFLQRTEKAIERKAAKVGLKKTKKYLKSLGR